MQASARTPRAGCGVIALLPSARMSTALELSNLPDADVVALAQAGRETAFRELIRRYERPVFSLIFRMIRDREMAEDLGPVAVDVIHHLDEGVLREILGHLAVADHPEDQAEDRPLVASNQLAEGRLPPFRRKYHHVRIWQVAQIERE